MPADDINPVASGSALPQIAELIDEMIRDYEKIPAGKFGKKIDDLREALKLSPGDFAKKCNVSVATFYRWARSKPPHNRVNDFKDLLGKNSDEGKKGNTSLYAAIRPFEDLLDRQETCSRQWALKTMLPFRAAKHQGIKSRLTFFLEHDPNPDFNCVFYGNQNDDKDSQVSRWSAMNSFGQFKQMLYRKNKLTLNRIRGWLVTDEALAYRLGLTSLSLGLTILEYGKVDPEKMSQRQNLPLAQRNVDYFFEIPIALYVDENDPAGIEARSNGEEQTCWIEWPAHRSSQDWIHRRIELEKMVNGYYKDGVKEFLSTAEAVENFVPKDYPN